MFRYKGILLLMLLYLSACASVQDRREAFKQELDATVGKPIAETQLRDGADRMSISDDGERRYYSLKQQDCKWSVLTESSADTVESWRYESAADECYTRNRWGLPW
jgi:hypothetical protein